MLEKSIEIAVKAHKNQKDKGEQPYILHPLRVMMKQSNDVCKIVAVLHDVIEDSKLTLDDLINDGFTMEIISALDCLTHRKGENYFDYIRRIKTNPIALFVKYADLEDNMDMNRIKNPTDKDYERKKKYQKALNILLGLSE